MKGTKVDIDTVHGILACSGDLRRNHDDDALAIGDLFCF